MQRYALTSSAQTAGAIYNSEADFVDSGGHTHQLPLELLNPDQGHRHRHITQGAGRQRGGGARGPEQHHGSDHHGHRRHRDRKQHRPTIDPTTGLPIAPRHHGTTTTGTTTGPASDHWTTTTTQTPNSFAVFLDGTSDLVPFTPRPTPAARASC